MCSHDTEETAAKTRLGELQSTQAVLRKDNLPRYVVIWIAAYLGSRVRDTAISEVATTSTEICWSLKMLKILARKPNWPSMRVLTMSMRVTSLFSTMLVIRALLMSRCREISVPAASLTQVLSLSVANLLQD